MLIGEALHRELVARLGARQPAAIELPLCAPIEHHGGVIEWSPSHGTFFFRVVGDRVIHAGLGRDARPEHEAAHATLVSWLAALDPHALDGVSEERPVRYVEGSPIAPFSGHAIVHPSLTRAAPSPLVTELLAGRTHRVLLVHRSEIAEDMDAVWAKAQLVDLRGGPERSPCSAFRSARRKTGGKQAGREKPLALAPGRPQGLSGVVSILKTGDVVALENAWRHRLRLCRPTATWLDANESRAFVGLGDANAIARAFVDRDEVLREPAPLDVLEPSTLYDQLEAGSRDLVEDGTEPVDLCGARVGSWRGSSCDGVAARSTSATSCSTNVWARATCDRSSRARTSTCSRATTTAARRAASCLSRSTVRGRASSTHIPTGRADDRGRTRMSEVGLAAVAAVAVFGGLIYLANRFNESEIRRTRRKHLRELAADSLTDVRASGDRIEGTHDGVPIRLEGGWTPGMRLDEIVVTTTTTIVGGCLVPFTVPSITESALSGEGLPTDRVPRNELLLRASLTCDGRTIAVRTTRSWAVRSGIALAAQLAHAPHHVLSRLARDAGRDDSGLDVTTPTLRLGSASRPVAVTIDRGVRLSLDASPLEGLTSGSLAAGIAALRSHERGPELHALASELTGTLEIERRTDGDRLSLTLPLATSTDRVVRAVELVERLTEPKRGAFR
jgi:hypothetical protein